MYTKKAIKRIKENFTDVECKKLMTFARGDENLRKNTKLNLLRTFTILYFTGLRLNELQEIQIHDILSLLKNESVKINIAKTSNERKLYLSNLFKKELLKLFDFENEDTDNRIITKGSAKNRKTGINNIVFIQQVNSVIKNILGKGYTSHSFRQGLITEMACKSVNPKS